MGLGVRPPSLSPRGGVVVADEEIRSGGRDGCPIAGKGSGNAFLCARCYRCRERKRDGDCCFAKKYGRIDILINNAGITADGMLDKLTSEKWQKVLDVNLTGVFHCTQAVVPQMVKQGDRADYYCLLCLWCLWKCGPDHQLCSDQSGRYRDDPNLGQRVGSPRDPGECNRSWFYRDRDGGEGSRKSARAAKETDPSRQVGAARGYC